MFTDFGHSREEQRNALRRVPDFVSQNLGHTVFRDDVSYNLYSGGSGEVAKAQKIVRVRNSHGNPTEITEFPDTVIHKTLMEKMKLTRFYFLTEEEKAKAEHAMRGR